MFENIKLCKEERKILKNFINIKEIEEYSSVEYLKKECECGNDKFDYDKLADDKICIVCGVVQNFTSANIGFIQYKQINKIEPSIYKPIAHLKLILEEMSCKRVSVDDDMIYKIKNKLNGKKVTYKNVKKLLRKLGYTQHYLQMPCILNTLEPKNFPFLKMSSNQIRKIERLFKMFVETYFSLSLKERQNRKNIINYHYIIKKICIKLGYDHVLTFLHPPNKGTTKKLEEIWKIVVDKTPVLG